MSSDDREVDWQGQIDSLKVSLQRLKAGAEELALAARHADRRAYSYAVALEACLSVVAASPDLRRSTGPRFIQALGAIDLQSPSGRFAGISVDPNIIAELISILAEPQAGWTPTIVPPPPAPTT